jgi:CRISPR-associated protein Cmx8
MTTLAPDLYDAKRIETSSQTKRQGKAPKREEVMEVTDPETGKVKKSKRFIYDDVVPKASFLAHHYPGGEEGWLKLWRDMLWSTLRGRSTTHLVYEERAAHKPGREAENAWKALVKFSQGAKKGLLVAETSSSLFIGAQASNAEKVPFVGRVEQNFLLHFWPLTVQVFRPQVIERDKNRNLKGYVLNPKGYAIAVPEVSNLEEFCDIFPRVLASLDVQRQGYLPRAALIDLPAEGGLEFLRHLMLIVQQKAGHDELKCSLSAVELFHLHKPRHDIKLLAADKIIPRRGLLGQYEGIRAFCRNPFFKSQLLINLLRDVIWYDGFERLFATYPWAFFVNSDNTPKTFALFASDARKKFEVLAAELQRQREAHAMAETTSPKPQSLERRVYDMIGAYVGHKAEAKSGIKRKDFRDKGTQDGKRAIPSEYLKARQEVCADVFLAMRSRREQDFIGYFTGTICSVPQFLPPDEYVFVSQTLLEEGGWEKVKTLSMLALAAHSWKMRQ